MGWPWQILGAICAVATAEEPGEILLLFFVFSRRPNFTKFEHKTSVGVTVTIKTFEQNFENFTLRVVFKKKTKKILKNVHVADIYVGVLMYADDLLLISSTCSDLRRMLRTVFSKPTVCNTVIFNTAVFF